MNEEFFRLFGFALMFFGAIALIVGIILAYIDTKRKAKK